MFAAFLRLGWITLAALTMGVFAVIMVRFMGQQQMFAPPPHPWFEKAYWTVYQPPDICSGLAKVKPEDLVQLTVHYEEGEWRTPCGTLDQMLKSSTHKDWILRVKAKDATFLDKLVDTVSPFDQQKKFGIVTDSQRAARFLRKKAPQWLFAADPSSLVRMQIFTSLWIETAMDFWPDFVFASDDRRSSAYIPERLARELERRHKRIVWDGHENPIIPVQGRVITKP